MKVVVILVAGIALGVGGILAFQNPHKLGGQAHHIVDQAEQQVAAVKKQKCVDDYLARTHCYEVKGNTQEFCASEIAKECN